MPGFLRFFEKKLKKLLTYSTEYGNDDSIEFELDEDPIKETEKAIYVAIKTETYGERYHAALKFWIPKSQILA